MRTQLDELDRKILSILMSDGRMSNVDIARMVESSEATVRRRIQTMLADGVIQVIAVADPSVVGLPVQVIIGLKVTLTKIHEAVRYLVAKENVRFVSYTTGPYDLIIQAYFASNEALFAFLTDELAEIPGIISTETSSVLKVAKRTWTFQLKPQESEYGQK